MHRAAPQLESRVVTGPWQSFIFLHLSCCVFLLGAGGTAGGAADLGAGRGKDLEVRVVLSLKMASESPRNALGVSWNAASSEAGLQQ